MGRLNVAAGESGFVVDISVFMPFVCLDDRLDQFVPDNIPFGKIDECYAVNTVEYPDDLDESPTSSRSAGRSA